MLLPARRVLLGLVVITMAVMVVPVAAPAATGAAPRVVTGAVATESAMTTLSAAGWQNTNVIAVSAGGEGACAIQGAQASATSGALYCWGASKLLGTGAAQDSNVPVQVSATNGFDNTAVTAVAVGTDHVCAIERGMLWCWGAPTINGVLGAGATNSSPTPIKVSSNAGFDNLGQSGDSVTAVDLSFDRTCAIEGAAVFCWGTGMDSSIDDVFAETYNTPRRVKDSQPAGLHAASAAGLGAGSSHACALASGSVYCWGAQGLTQLGHTRDQDGRPGKVVQGAMVTGNINVTAIESGRFHSCAIQSGTLFCWGGGGSGQLGNGSIDAFSAPVAVSANAGFANSGNVTAVSGGGTHTCAVQAGTLYCWGANGNGQLGNGSTTASNVPVAVSANAGFANSGNVTSVSGGADHTCAVESGVVYCWGDSFKGRLGAGQVFGVQNLPVKVFVTSAPSAPTITVSSGSSGSLNVSVSKPADGGSPITDYEYEVDSGTPVAVQASGGNSQIITISNLTNGTAYSIRVRAVNAVGPGAWSAASTGTPSASGGGGGGGGGFVPPPPAQCTTGPYTLTGSSPVLDTSWGTTGWTTVTTQSAMFMSRALIATPAANDDTLLLFSTVSSPTRNMVEVRKLGLDGTLVNAFGTGGVLTVEHPTASPTVMGHAVDAAGNIFVLGYEFFNRAYTVVALTPTGQLDVSYGTNGFVTGTLPQGADFAARNPIYGGASGEFYLSTSTMVQGQLPVFEVRKFASSGLVNGFGSSGVIDVTSIGGRTVVVLPDGSLLVGGGVQGQLALAKYSSAGVLDTAWATNGVATFGNPALSEQISGLALAGQSIMVTYTVFTFAQGSPPSSQVGVARVGLDGAVDTTFGRDGGVLAPARSMFSSPAASVLLSDGSILVGLFTETAFQQATFGMVRFSSAGRLDAAHASADATITHGNCAVQFVGLVEVGGGGAIVAGSKLVSGGMPPSESVLGKVTYTAVVPGADGGGFSGSGGAPQQNNNQSSGVVPPPPPGGSTGSVPSTPTGSVPSTPTGSVPAGPVVVSAPAAGAAPSMVSAEDAERVQQTPGSGGVLVNGEPVAAQVSSLVVPAADVAPQDRTPEQVAAVQQAAAALVEVFNAAVPEGAAPLVTVTNTDTGAVVNGVLVDPRDGVTPVPVPAEDVVVLSAAEIKVLFAAASGDAVPSDASGAVLEVSEGGVISAVAYGFPSSVPGEVVIFSTPTMLGSFTIGADGSFAGQMGLPAGLESGDHTLVLTAGGVTTSLGLKVAGDGSASLAPLPTIETLPSTGTSHDPTLWMLLVTLGGLMVWISRRRHV